MNLNNLNLIDGIQFMPVRKDKRPIHNNWQEVKTKYDMSNCEAVGIVCGSISGNLEAIDFDLKYDTTGTLMNDYIQAVNNISPNLISKLVVQRTVSGGYHILYRCVEIEGNQKLANRHSTLDEKNKTYQSSLESKISELRSTVSQHGKNENEIFIEASVFAKRSSENDKVRVLIETRGEKGYIACAPTPGYELIQGSFENIPEINIEERSILFDVAFSFNSYFKNKEDRPQLNQQRKNYKGLSPSEDYDQRGDVVALLQSHGWTVKGRQGSKILLKRPGDSKAKTSGNFDEDKNWFSVFTTSTEFESQKPYKPYAVFAMLECGGDYSLVTKKLADLGYGTPLEKIREIQSEEVPSQIDMTDDEDLSFLATDEDFDDYINRWRTGNFEMGLTTGMPKLDNFFRFKKGNMVVVNGIDNVGKSSIVWFLFFLAAFLHGWKGIIFSAENHVGTIKKKMLEFFWCKKISELTDEEYKVANEFFKEHFRIIKNGQTMYNHKDFRNMLTKILKVFPANMALADPYNAFKLEKKTNSYDYHYEAASELKLFGERNNLSIWLNMHVNTTAARKKDDKGFTLAPGKEDSEMGVMFANKADEFITLHRLTDHEDDFKYTEFHVRKVKETETGGRPTPKFNPIYLMPVNNMSGFVQVDSKKSGDMGINPVLTHRENKENLKKFDIFTSKAVVSDLPPVINGGEDDTLPF